MRTDKTRTKKAKAETIARKNKRHNKRLFCYQQGGRSNDKAYNLLIAFTYSVGAIQYPIRDDKMIYLLPNQDRIEPYKGGYHIVTKTALKGKIYDSMIKAYIDYMNKEVFK